MSRIRITLVTALVVALAAAAINSQAQPPPGGRGGGRGQRGGGPGGGPGGWGGPGGNLIMLAGNEAVAKELKLTDRQKAKVKQISDDQNKKRGEVFQQIRQQADMAKAQAAQQAQAEALQAPQIDPSVDARGSGAGNALAGALNSRGYLPPIYGGRLQEGQIDPAQQQQAAQLQGQQAANAVQAQGFQMMREAMQELQQASEGELARVLDKNQVKRLKEIQLQVEGPAAVLRDDVAEKLEINEEQHAEIQTILNEANTARRQIMQKNFQLVRSLMPNQPAGGNPPAADSAAGQSQCTCHTRRGPRWPGWPTWPGRTRRTRWTRRRQRAEQQASLRSRGDAESHGATRGQGPDGRDSQGARTAP